MEALASMIIRLDTIGPFLWGYVKQTVYSARIINIQHLKQWIKEAVESIIPNVLHRMWSKVEQRLEIAKPLMELT